LKLTLGFSPCPNDTFIFDALVNKKIDTGEFEFDVLLEDVETLNHWALRGKLDITKLSFPAFFQSTQYILLQAGSALGKGVGPLLISKKKSEYSTEEIQDSTIAIPGNNTTANLLLTFAYPGAKQKRAMTFSQIEDAVLDGTTDLGVIIHENRFTYHQKGLHKVMDLGEYWEQKMKSPIPLGAIAMKSNIESPAATKVNGLIRKSIEYAYDNYPSIAEFVKRNSGQMSEDVMRQHIDLYVNSYSLDLGAEGRQAIQILYGVYNKINSANRVASDLSFL
jgi:1,4-dihydroxy-6-naphthoate synthase